MTGSRDELPPDTVTVRGGKVVRVEHWVLWNQEPWKTIDIEREGDAFRCSMGSPGDGLTSVGDLEHVVSRFHENTGQLYRELLSLQEATPEAIRRAGMERVLVVFQ